MICHILLTNDSYLRECLLIIIENNQRILAVIITTVLAVCWMKSVRFLLAVCFRLVFDILHMCCMLSYYHHQIKVVDVWTILAKSTFLKKAFMVKHNTVSGKREADATKLLTDDKNPPSTWKKFKGDSSIPKFDFLKRTAWKYWVTKEYWFSFMQWAMTVQFYITV